MSSSNGGIPATLNEEIFCDAYSIISVLKIFCITTTCFAGKKFSRAKNFRKRMEDPHDQPARQP